MSDAHASHFHGRVEDRRLVTGTGKYAADWKLPGQLYAAFVRSDRAHAEIASVNTAKALKHPGVKKVYTGQDALAAGFTQYFVIVNWPGRRFPQIVDHHVVAALAHVQRHVAAHGSQPDESHLHFCLL